MNPRHLRSVFLVSAAVFAGGFVALAASTDYGTPPRVVAYSGTLDQNGMAVNGDIPMTFFLLRDPAFATAQAVWSEDRPAANPVRVSGGKFAVQLGTVTPIPDAVFSTGDLYVAVSVAGVELAGRQRIFSSPYAVTAAQARDFTIAGNAVVSGTTTLNGPATVNATTTVNGRLVVNSQAPDGGPASAFLENIALTRAWSGWPDGANDRAEISNDTTNFKELMLVGNKAAALGTGRQVGIYDRLTVHGTLRVTGKYETLHPADNATPAQQVNADNDAPWGTWGNWKYCPSATYVCGFRQSVEPSVGSADDTAMNAVQLACCPFAF